MVQMLLREMSWTPWQKFAHDIVTGPPGVTTREEPVRLMLLGTAGTGKSRTVRSFVCTVRDRLRTQFEEKIQASLSAESVGVKVRSTVAQLQEQMEESLSNACLLAAPTGCASFQLKFGASTLHRVFGIPVGYCGPWKNRTDGR